MTMGYYTQHQMDTLRGDTTVLGEIRRLSDPHTTEEELMSVLGLFMLGQDYFERQVSALSGGEKSRLVLATLFLKRCNFLLLDEPTNHLDLESREALVSALQKFNGTLLMPPDEIEGKLFITRFLGKGEGHSPLSFGSSATRGSEKYEAEIRSSTGKTINVLVTRAKVPESGLSVISLLDISERSAMERELAYRANHVFKNARGHFFGVKFTQGQFPSGLPHTGNAFRTGDEGFHSACQRLRIAYRYKVTVDAVAHNLAAAGGVRDHSGATHAHSLHNRGRCSLTPRGQHKHMGGSHIGAYVACFTKVFYAALILPCIHLFHAHAAEAFFRWAEHLKAGIRVPGLEQARGFGIFRQALGFKQARHQQKNRRSAEAAIGGIAGQGAGGKALCVHPGAARCKHPCVAAKDARLAENLYVVLILKKNAFRARKRHAV